MTKREAFSLRLYGLQLYRRLSRLAMAAVSKVLFPAPPSRRIDTILVFRTGFLGDTICALPAIQAVREAYPEAKMVLLTDRHSTTSVVLSQEILAPTAIFDEILTYIPAQFNLKSASELIKRLRPYQFDLLVYLVNSRRTTVTAMLRDMIFFRLARVRRTVGFRQGIIRAFLDAQIKQYRFDHESVRFLRILHDAGIPCSLTPQFDLPVGHEEYEVVDKLWKKASIPGDRFIVAVGPGSKMPAKRWPLERFCDVAQILVEQHHAFLIVLGGTEDANVGQEIVECVYPYGVNWAGTTSIMQSAAVLSRCGLYVGNDTGTMHLAAAMGIPCVAIFSARDVPDLWYPYGEKHTVLRKAVSCQYCMLVECIKNQTRCLTEISVDEVVDACRRYFPGIEDPSTQRYRNITNRKSVLRK